MTFTVALSTKEVELIQSFTEGGTTNGTFEAYFEKLLKGLHLKYPTKSFVVILDNLWSHKSSLIMELLTQYS